MKQREEKRRRRRGKDTRSARLHAMGREDKRERERNCSPDLARRRQSSEGWLDTSLAPTLVSRFEYKCEIFTARRGEPKGKPRLRATLAIYIPLRAFIAPFLPLSTSLPVNKDARIWEISRSIIWNLSSHISYIFYLFVVVRLIWSFCCLYENCAIRRKESLEILRYYYYKLFIIMYLCIYKYKYIIIYNYVFIYMYNYIFIYNTRQGL